MLENPTIEGLRQLRLPAMAAGVAEQRAHPDYDTMSFEDRLGLLVDKELAERSNRRLGRLVKQARFKDSRARVEDLDFAHRRGLERSQVLSLAESHWVTEHQVLLVTGATGVGKTYLACALAHAAVRRGHSALYLRAPRMFDELAIARADGRLAGIMASYARVEILVVDDLLLRPLTAEQGADLLEVIEDRARLRATVITSQLPVEHWHEALGGEPTVSDAVMDRLLERAHRIELTGDSLRRPQLQPPKPVSGTAPVRRSRRSNAQSDEQP
jgi:DNA replication protein DnaC